MQNDLMELWSLMHFLMPHIFHSHAQFQDWFSNPLTGMVEGAAAVSTALVARLHAVLRPFMLRRLKQVRCLLLHTYVDTVVLRQRAMHARGLRLGYACGFLERLCHDADRETYQ